MRESRGGMRGLERSEHRPIVLGIQTGHVYSGQWSFEVIPEPATISQPALGAGMLLAIQRFEKASE
jgi:hypothetical protein